MSSVDGDINMTDALGHDQDLDKIENVIIKAEKEESANRGSTATPAKSGAKTRSRATRATKGRSIDSIEGDDGNDPVTPAKSSTRVVRGKGKKSAGPKSSKKTGNTKVVADEIAKTQQNSKKKNTKKGLKNIDGEPIGENLTEDDDNGDDWEDENEGVRSDDNTWDQVNKVIGSTGKPTHPNGRAEGRKLVSWHSKLQYLLCTKHELERLIGAIGARMMEKLLLHIVFECRRADIELPWDKIAHRLCPASSGGAAQQYINKLRDILIPEGHLVPPPLGKKAVIDASIRGYIRDMSAEDPKKTRPVGWDEDIIDLKESLVIPGVSRGSGTYRRDKVKWQGNSATINEETPTKVLRGRTRTRSTKQPPKLKSEPNEKAMKIKKERSESLDPAEMPSDEDYNPGNRLKIKGYRKRKVKVKSTRKYSTDDEEKEQSTESEESGYSGNDSHPTETPSKKKAALTLPVKLKLSPEVLSQFPAGVPIKIAKDTDTSNFNDNDDPDADGSPEEGYNFDGTAMIISAPEGDDVFGQGGVSRNNMDGAYQQTQSLGRNNMHSAYQQTQGLRNNFVGDMNNGYDMYNPRGPMNVSGYLPAYNASFDSRMFANAGVPPFETAHGSNPYSEDQYLSFPNLNEAPGLHNGFNFGDPSSSMVQDMNRGRNDMRSFSLSTRESSNNGSFANGSVSTGRVETPFDFEQVVDSPNPGWPEYNSTPSFNQNQGL